MSGTLEPFAALFATIAPDVAPSSGEGEFIRSLFVPRRVAKGDFYQRAGEVTTHGGFIVRGCCRTYAIDAEGNENIIFFSPERTWVGDIHSARTQRPTAYHVDAIEAAELVVITLADFDRLLARFPDIARRYQLGLEQMGASRARKIAFGLKSTAEERYLDFIERNPSIATRVPQRMLASHLGMTPETLSRVRHKLRER